MSVQADVLMEYFAGRFEAETGTVVDEQKMHKLLYFFQRESFARFGIPQLTVEFYGWKFGPVCKEVRKAYREGRFLGGARDTAKLEDSVKEAADYVYERYGQADSWNLCKLSRGDYAWRQARRGLPEAHPGTRKLLPADIEKDGRRIRERRKTLLQGERFRQDSERRTDLAIKFQE